jgi:hypothetical protein
MSETVAKLAARKGRLPALIAALAVFAWIAFGDLLQVLISIGWRMTADSQGSLYDLGYGDYWAGFGSGLIFRTLPFALGVFVSLWAIAPISHELTVRFVLTRGGLAGLAGSIVAAVIAIVVGFFAALHLSDSPFGASLFAGGFDGQMFVNTVVGSLIGIVAVAISLFPLVALVAVLLWLWLREHPREYEISGLIDEL